ncbi:uncharacterized protein LOC124654881 [Lolium rigidum]|uniref:uncharacterized protein LOC124654881 n=1 Tax=Lolium rigidum TaxID=89674 RepID=UPI001F5E0CA7|nr:uncharacterized protein LOC124654881 [Lolium rigidum]
MATSQSNAPSFFNFLKEGLLLPSRNRRLFTAVSAFILAATALIVLANDLGLQPLADEIKVDIKALNTTEPGSLEYAKLVQEIRNDARELLLVGAGYLLLALVVGAAVRIVVLFAAVSTYSGEQPATTFGALLGKAKAQIKGPLLTLAFIYVLEIVYVALLVAMVGLVSFLAVKQYFVTLLVASLLVIAASVCLVYFSFICSFSVVVAVAEPGCYGAAALGKAWRLVKGKKWQVVLYVAVTAVLAAAVSPVRTLATTCAVNSVALGLLLGIVYAVLLALVQLFTICAMAAFYYERRESVDSQLGATGYAKLSTEEANA